MGNWFGTQEVAAPPPKTSQRTSTSFDIDAHFRNLTIGENRTPTVRSSYTNNWVTQSQYGSTTRGYSTVAPIQPTVRRSIQNPLKEIKPITPESTYFVVDKIRNCANEFYWDDVSYDYQQVHFIPLNMYSTEYQKVGQLFSSTNKKCFQITHIERIQNPYLLAAFLLKKKEMSEKIGYVQIKDLFHGTKAGCVRNICNDNFDWRRYGENVGNKFGQGISFTPISNYATHYADDVMEGRIMLLAYVLVGEEIIGTKDMILPPKGIDTSIKPDRHVIVKYEDNEFYPAYKITYKCTYANELQQRKVKNGGYKKGQHKQASLRASAVYYSDDN